MVLQSYWDSSCFEILILSFQPFENNYKINNLFLIEQVTVWLLIQTYLRMRIVHVHLQM